MVWATLASCTRRGTEELNNLIRLLHECQAAPFPGTLATGSSLASLMTLSLLMLGLVISDQATHVVSAAIYLGAVVAIFARAYLAKSESSLPLPPSPPTWRLWGHILPPRK
jgi:hypothetical protein